MQWFQKDEFHHIINAYASYFDRIDIVWSIKTNIKIAHEVAKGRRQKKVVLLGGAYDKVAYNECSTQAEPLSPFMCIQYLVCLKKRFALSKVEK